MKIDYENIIVAVDGSEAANKAFERALSIAKQRNARLIITNVIDTRTIATAEAYDRTLSEQAENYANELINRYIKQAEEAGIHNYVKTIEYGSPKVKIAKEVAKTYEADLIICGATGMNAVERFLMGSVSESITKYAKCDVLVVR